MRYLAALLLAGVLVLSAPSAALAAPPLYRTYLPSAAYGSVPGQVRIRYVDAQAARITLHNWGAEQVSLAGWTLRADGALVTNFAAVHIQSGQDMLVYAPGLGSLYQPGMVLDLYDAMGVCQ